MVSSSASVKCYRVTPMAWGYRPFSGRIAAPPSKSHTLRAILFASMAVGNSRIFRYLPSPDTVSMIHACRALGAEVRCYHDRLEIKGVAGKPTRPSGVIDAGNSGLVLRFISSIAALLPGCTVVTGDHSIRTRRPIQPLIAGLSGLGARCVTIQGSGYAPLEIHGPIKPGSTCLEGADSQPVSGVLIASAFLPGTTHVKVNHPGEIPWLGVTLSWFDRLGIAYTHTDFMHYQVEGGKPIMGFDYTVPGDFSTVAYPLAVALMTGATLRLTQLDWQDAQGDKQLIDVLSAMGAIIERHVDGLTVHPRANLQGRRIDVNPIIDALPVLSVLGCVAAGQTHLYNAHVARSKESDRIHAMCTQLRVMGAVMRETEDGLIVTGNTALQGGQLQSFQDHRVAMSLTVAALAAQTTAVSVIHDVQCIQKTYPHFYRDMRTMGASIEETVA